MASAVIQQAKVFENSSAVLMARVVADDGDAVVRADISSITCAVYNAETAVLVASPTLTVAGNIFNTLEINSAWIADDTGFNFSAALSGTNFPDGGVTYQVEIVFTPVSGYSFKIVYQLQTLNTFGD